MSGHLYRTREDLRIFAEETSKRFFQLLLSLSFLFLVVRVFEYSYISNIHTLPANSLRLAASGIFYDIIFLLKICSYSVIPFFLISYYKSKIAEIIFISISALLLLSNLLLIFYYSKSLVPLGADLFGYSVEEIIRTFQASGGFNLLMVLAVLVLIVLVVLAFRFSRKIPLQNKLVYLLSAVLISSFFVYDNFTPNTKEYETDLEFYTVVNKLQFFSGRAIPYLLKEEDEVISGDYFIDSDVDQQNTFTYVNKNFPFLRIDSSQNVLGNFFQTTDELPNFVFIITESLGRSYSGEGAIDGSFTPFLDSLAGQSLYWKNFLSTSGRTFAVFSSLFGSLPFAEKGFLELGEKMPPHFSLISLLKQLGYSTAFYHGGDVHFDNMDTFFKRQQVDFVLGDKNFGSGYKKMPAKADQFSWGYGDKDLFKRSLEIIGQQRKSPRVDIYMTLSMHDPFLIEGQEYYRNKVHTQLQTMDLSLQQKQKYEKYIDIFATVMYTDDAFKYFFEEYKKRNDFKNTIFIITGDHRMPEIPIKTKLDRFHVPFLIYSPMLKRTETFSSVSTHFDVLPSLISFLRENYKIETPKYVTWLGSGLDTVKNFRNIHSAPLMRNKNELLDYLNQIYFLTDEEVFEVFDNLIIRKIKDDVVQSRLQNYFSEYKLKNKIMLTTKTLLPDSVLYFTPRAGRQEGINKK
ncbi:MAG: LTA synthase family protein [Ignavibacteriaceae bacterium]|nr:LTA synthase family protein [Ignavibacteriaceae bacterium]